MLEVLSEFRNKLSKEMRRHIGKRILIYGYGYSGQFLEWYADYYHVIKVDYIILANGEKGIPYKYDLFRESLLEFGYKDVKNATIWLAVPYTDELKQKLSEMRIPDENITNFYETIYGSDYYCEAEEEKDAFLRKKTGLRGIQFMEYLEWRYGCNLVEQIIKPGAEIDYAMRYSITTQKEIFGILDKCHIENISEKSIDDFGCGKGGAIISFIDYGFRKVGGVEYENKIYDICKDNFSKLNLWTSAEIRLYNADAASMKEELDGFDVFYFFDPFFEKVFCKTIDNICDRQYVMTSTL